MKIKLFCFPFADASAVTFNKWKSYLAPEIELITVKYPGHGKRFNTKLCHTMAALIEDLYSGIMADIKGAPYAFFGHNVGALAAFELCYQIHKHKEKLPVNLFFSGHVSPTYTKNKKVIFDLPDEQFINEIISYGGISIEIFESEELKELFLPILRADLEVADRYAVADPDFKLDIDFDVFCSKGDPLLNAEGIAAWKDLTNRECRIINFEGDHMYLMSKGKEVAAYINSILTNH